MSEKNNNDREIIILDEELWGDHTNNGPWECNGETYVFVEDYPSRGCDGECHNVVVIRQSDEKYFKFTWEYSNHNYYFGDELTEVFPEKTVTVKYK